MKPHHDTALWSLQKEAREASAVLRYIEGYGYEVRFLLNGEMYQSRMFRGEGDQALAFAKEKREELETKGWAEREATEQ